MVNSSVPHYSNITIGVFNEDNYCLKHVIPALMQVLRVFCLYIKIAVTVTQVKNNSTTIYVTLLLG